MGALTFETTLTRSSNGPTGIVVPPSVIDELAGGKKPRLKVKVNDYVYSTTVGVMGGTYMLPFSSDHRKKSGINAGDRIVVELTLETGPIDIQVPSALAEALDREGPRQKFDSCAPSRRKEFARLVDDAKTDETRDRRILKIITELS